jgi:hypothetical protein
LTTVVFDEPFPTTLCIEHMPSLDDKMWHSILSPASQKPSHQAEYQFVIIHAYRIHQSTSSNSLTLSGPSSHRMLLLSLLALHTLPISKLSRPTRTPPCFEPPRPPSIYCPSKLTHDHYRPSNRTKLSTYAIQ